MAKNIYKILFSAFTLLACSSVWAKSNFSRQTIDLGVVVTDAKKHGYEAYAKSPQILPKGFPQDLCLLMLKDPDGNFVEIVGSNTKALKQKK